jgi:flagellar hook assembly protein FlgD
MFFLVPDSGARVRLRVFDASGRSVRDLVDGRLEGGRHAVRWDGRDTDGRRLATGVFFLQLTVDGRSATTRIIRVR